jgi:hypothetical protein
MASRLLRCIIAFYNRLNSSKEKEEEQQGKGYQSGYHTGYR